MFGRHKYKIPQFQINYNRRSKNLCSTLKLSKGEFIILKMISILNFYEKKQAPQQKFLKCTCVYFTLFLTSQSTGNVQL